MIRESNALFATLISPTIVFSIASVLYVISGAASNTKAVLGLVTVAEVTP